VNGHSEDRAMATPQPPGETTPPQEPPTAVSDAPATPDAAPPAADQPEKHRNVWLWLSIALAIAVVGLLVWGLNKQSDANAANDQAAQARAQADQQQDGGTAIVAGMKSAYDDLKQQLGATDKDLQQTQDDLDQAQQDADQAQKDASSAKQDAADSKSETDKANAQADEAKARADEAQSKAAIVTDCAQAYFSAFGKLLDGSGADQVKQEIQGLTADCKGALAGT
jgi:Alanine-zipper, major outer membrane lipoprotein